MKKFVALTTLFVVALASVAFAEITLKGKVVDAKTGKALAGANVRLVGTSIGIARKKYPTGLTRFVPATPATRSVP